MKLAPAPLTPSIIRGVLGWPQIRVAALAGVSVSTVRIYELDEHAVSLEKRRALAATYARMREMLLARPAA